MNSILKKLFILISIAIQVVYAQPVEKIIREKNIIRILSTLSSDQMMGRPASRPELIEPSTRFLEEEFHSIGLQFFPGLTSYRQRFTKTKITGSTIELTIDGSPVKKENVILLSEKPEIQSTNNWKIIKVVPEKEGGDLFRQLVTKFRSLSRDTTSSILLVDESFRESFERFKGFMQNRFTSGQSGTKLLVLGHSEIKTYSLKAQVNLESIPMANVVGVIPGKSRKEELVIFSAHYDHIGIQKSVEGDSIANGADDDASGTTAVVALARYFSKIKNNERTLIFIAFTAEEIGGFGSQFFSSQMNPEKTIAMFNIEMIGKQSKFGPNTAWITGFERSDFGEILQKNLAGTPFEFKPDPYPEQNLFYRSDNATLARMGIPAHSISTDQIDIDKLYHSVDDEFGSMNIKNITSTIRAIALSSRSIISGKDTPGRIDPSTVR